MTRARITFLLSLAATLLEGCRRAPSRDEALRELQAGLRGMETTAVVRRVWTDGPPWFSCAEVIAKARTNRDSAVVRDEVGNWRSLVVADWIALRDTGAREVVDPGWCVANLRDEPARIASGWKRISGDTIPSGGVRRGWQLVAGRRALAVAAAPRRIGKDSAAADYLLTLVGNASGVAIGADRDTIEYTALFRRDGGAWKMVNPRWRPPTP